MSEVTIDHLIESAKKLPPSPQILPQLLTVLQDDDATYWEIARFINLDQALTSQILTWSNSGYYGYLDRSSDIEEAISRIGIGEIYKLVGIIMSKRLLDQPSTFYGLDPGQLWENSLAAAFSMEALSSRTGENANISYTVGLLHGIGKIVINQACEGRYVDVFEKVQEEGISIVEAERAVIGHDHAAVGQELLKRWNFQREIYYPIGAQYKPATCAEFKKLASMMNVSHFLVSALGQSYGREGMAIELDQSALKEVGIAEADLQMALIEVQDKIEQVKMQLNLV